MSYVRGVRVLFLLALFTLLGSLGAKADGIKKVFVIAMENHNWTQTSNPFGPGVQQIFQNANAPFINSLVNGTAVVEIDGRDVNPARQTAYATAYHNVLATPSGNNPHIHPSEPNYIWAEAGTNFGVLNDNDPFSPAGPTSQNTDQHLVAFLAKAGKTWRSYQEDIDLATNSSGQLINVVLPRDEWTVPLTSHSGVFASGVNAYNGSNQFNYAAKHNPQVFFNDSNGGNDQTPSNPLSHQYAPLQRLKHDLDENDVADYNWITPDQYNDMHSTLSGGYKGLAGDSANIKQGDDFLKQIIPIIMESEAYKDDGAIIIWWDESEQDSAADNPDDFGNSIGEIVISPLARHNNGAPYASDVNYTHSSDLRTMEEIFGLRPFLQDAAEAHDLSRLFEGGVIPNSEE